MSREGVEERRGKWRIRKIGGEQKDKGREEIGNEGEEGNSGRLEEKEKGKGRGARSKIDTFSFPFNLMPVLPNQTSTNLGCLMFMSKSKWLKSTNKSVRFCTEQFIRILKFVFHVVG
jgi:hypothetical protein